MPATERTPKARKRGLKSFLGKIWSKTPLDIRPNYEATPGKNLAASPENHYTDVYARDRLEEKLTRERVRQNLECPICTDIFLDPVNLLCGHTFCLHCLANDYTRRGKNSLVCSICRDATTTNVIISRTLRDVVESAFADEERHRRETLTFADRQAVSRLLADQHKSPDTLKMERFFQQARYGLLACSLFLLWFFYWD